MDSVVTMIVERERLGVNKVPPEVLMKKYDCAYSSVARACRVLGLETYPERTRRRLHEAIEGDSNLGKISDKNKYWTETYGTTKTVVGTIRRRLGIPSFKKLSEPSSPPPNSELSPFFDNWKRPSTYPVGDEFMRWRRET